MSQESKDPNKVPKNQELYMSGLLVMTSNPRYVPAMH